MISDEHFVAIRALREQAAVLRSACTNVAGTAAFLHTAYDQKVEPKLSREVSTLLRLIK